MKRYGMYVRYFISSGLAFGVTSGLFFLMHALVAMGDATIEEKKPTPPLTFTRIKPTTPVEPKQRKPPTRPTNDPTPPPVPPVGPGGDPGGTVTVVPESTTPEPQPPRMRPTLGGGSNAERDEMPLVRLNPEYPMRAAQDGVEGYVVMRFDVDPEGQVKNITVVNAQPRGVFEQAATRAMSKWRYRAKLVDGEGAWVRGRTVRMPFKLTD